MAVRFDVITLFPDLFAPFQTIGVTRRAFETQAVDVRLWPLRDLPMALTAVSTTVPLVAGRAW